MRIAIPKETHPGEDRVPVIPDVAKKLVRMGADVVIESGMGNSSGFTDADYESALAPAFPPIAPACSAAPISCCGCASRRWQTSA